MGNRFLYVLVFVVGTASLGAEIAAARLMAPFFGASTIVWANTIGVVLVALSIGYWLGGRIADRRPDLRSLCLVVLGAAVLLAVVPFVARPFFDVSVDALDEIEAGAFVGSLVGGAVPDRDPGDPARHLRALGAAARGRRRRARRARSPGGCTRSRPSGSLTGTMLAALVLIPFVGTQRTFLVFALALALVAAAGLGWRYVGRPAAARRRRSRCPVGTVKATDDGKVLYEDESEQQYIRVIEQPDGDRDPRAQRGPGDALDPPGRAAT